MKIISGLVQGSDEWKEHRANYYNASDAAAMLGLDKNTSRSELLRMYTLGHEKEFSDYVQRLILDKGHEVEALARPIVESELGDELYPVIGVSDEWDMLSASFDGLTDRIDTSFEHKQWNEGLAAQVRDGIVPDTHMPQLQQQMMISGAARCIFVVSDGTTDCMVHTFVKPDPAWFERIRAGWEQFHKDRENYQHVEVAERPQAQISIELPTLFVHATGEITNSNMREYGTALSAKLAEVRSIALNTDQNFSDAKEAAKLFRDHAKKLKAAKEAMLAQTVSIGEASRMIDSWAEDLNKTALQLEKDVEREDMAKKASMIDAAKLAFHAHIEALEAETRPIQIAFAKPDYAAAIKGKRNYQSMQDAIDAMLANGKIAADSEAKDISAKLAWCKETSAGYGFLFNDLAQIIRKPMDDFQLTVTTRINQHKIDVAAKEESQRLAMQAEADAKAKALADAEIAKAKAEQEATLAAEREKMEAQVRAEAEAKEAEKHVARHDPIAESKAPDVRHATSQAQADNGNSINLGEINKRLGFTVTADFLASLGFEARTDKNAKLFRECDFKEICWAIIGNIENTIHDHEMKEAA